MKKLISKKDVNLMIFLCMSMYFVSYLTRINYSAVLLEIVKTEKITKAVASLAITGSAVTYALGQIISGYMGDKLNAKYIIFGGLLTAGLMNIAIYFCKNPYAMIIIWCINGLAQAMLWPPLVRIMTDMFTIKDYKRGCVVTSWGSSFGTIAIYLFAPICIVAAGWRTLFLFTAIAGFAMSFIWLKGVGTMEKRKEHCEPQDTVSKNCESSKTSLNSSAKFILFFTMMAIIMQGVLRDGVTTWMPTYISETFHLGSAISILTGVILPIFSIASFQIAAVINKKFIRNEFTCAGVIFFAGALFSLLLFFQSARSAALSVFLSAGITSCMHGVNLMLISMLPPYFSKFGKVSFISGLLNSCTYVGSAVSTYGIAVLSDSLGWGMTILIWALVALMGTLFCVACISKKKTLE